MLQGIKIASDNHTPFGASLIDDHGELLTIAANTGSSDGPLAHAEMNVLKEVHKYKDRKLHLITTCEPCPMCAGVAVWANVSAIYFGVSISQAARFLKQIKINCDEILSYSWIEIPVTGSVLNNQCLSLFKKFI